MNTRDIIAHPANEREMDVITAFFKALKINFEVSDESPYDPAFVERVLTAKKQVEQGKTVKIDLDEIWQEK